MAAFSVKIGEKNVFMLDNGRSATTHDRSRCSCLYWVTYSSSSSSSSSSSHARYRAHCAWDFLLRNAIFGLLQWPGFSGLDFLWSHYRFKVGECRRRLLLPRLPAYFYLLINSCERIPMSLENLMRNPISAGIFFSLRLATELLSRTWKFFSFYSLQMKKNIYNIRPWLMKQGDSNLRSWDHHSLVSTTPRIRRGPTIIKIQTQTMIFMPLGWKKGALFLFFRIP